ncbi:uncharacterized protein LOC136759645 [Amia ocellicauda]|uniref:uncharacterized protein LOC136759645 n=1 Tax=Amia ocellicauda TaxID=2972642 RepID=UPI003463C67E
MAQRTAGVRRHNAVRFSREAGGETAELTRLEFSRSVLQRGLGFAPSELNCVVKLPEPRDVFEECGILFQKEYKDLQDTWTLGESFWSGSNVSRAEGMAVFLKNPFIEVIKTLGSGREPKSRHRATNPGQPAFPKDGMD